MAKINNVSIVGVGTVVPADFQTYVRNKLEQRLFGRQAGGSGSHCDDLISVRIRLRSKPHKVPTERNTITIVAKVKRGVITVGATDIDFNTAFDKAMERFDYKMSPEKRSKVRKHSPAIKRMDVISSPAYVEPFVLN